jgi:hypothetical protein
LSQFVEEMSSHRLKLNFFLRPYHHFSPEACALKLLTVLIRPTTLSIKGLYVTLSINDTEHNTALRYTLHFIYWYAECHYAKYRYAECRGAINTAVL